MIIYKKAKKQLIYTVKVIKSKDEKNVLKRIRDMLKKYEDKVISAFVAFWIAYGESINELSIDTIIGNINGDGNFNSDKMTEDYEQSLREFIDNSLYQTMETVGEENIADVKADIQAVADIPEQSLFSNVDTEDLHQNQFRYDVFYSQWCDERAGNLIIELTENQRNNVKTIINSTLQNGGYSVESVATRIKDTVGLTQRQLLANQRYYDTVYNGLKESNPKLSYEELDSRASAATRKMADRQRKQRARNIARTELNTAHNQSATAYIQWAIEHGYITNVYRKWVTSGNDNMCPICLSLAGQTVPFHENYKIPAGVTFKDNKVHHPPIHPNCCCGEEFLQGDDAEHLDVSKWYSMTDSEKKAHINYYSDKEQYKLYIKRLGRDNMPKTLAEFQNMKYNDNDKWEDLKYYYRNINDRPIEYVKIDRELEKVGIIGKGKAYPIVNVEIKGWRNHAEKRLIERGITKEQAVSFQDSAIVMMKKYSSPNTQLNYYSDNGVIGILMRNNNVSTVYSKEDYKDDTLKLLEVAKKCLML